MRWDKDRLQTITENLNFTLNESIYRNALPMNADRIDLAVASIGSGFPGLFAKQLLSNRNMEMEIQVNEEMAGRFHHLHIESINHKIDKGSHTLAFGYPLFIHKQQGNSLAPIAAPMFIWQLDLQPSVNRPDTWLLSRNKDTPILINRFFIRYISEQFGLDIETEIRKPITEKSLTGDRLSSLCNHLSMKLGIDGNTSAFALKECPGADEINEMGEEPQIRFSGILSQFSIDHHPLSFYLKDKSEEEIGDIIFEEEEDLGSEMHPFSLFAPDPCQKNIGIHVNNNRQTLAEGGAGTGKTMTAFHVASNQLANGKNCLIISPNLKNLQQVKKSFEDNGLGNYSILIKDIHSELTKLYHSIKNIPSQLKKEEKETDLGFKILLERCLRKHTKLESHYELLNRKAFGNLDFTDTVGHYISSSRNAGKDVLSGRLDAKLYQSSFREYDMLKMDLAKAEQLHAGIGKNNKALSELHEEIFLEKNTEEAENFIQQNTSKFKTKTEELLRRFTTGLESYRDNLREHYEEHARELHHLLQETKDRIGEYAQIFGEDFKKAGSVKVRMYGVFSDTFYNIKEARQEILSNLDRLEGLYNEKRYFEYKFPTKKEREKIVNIQRYLNDFEESLESWKNEIPDNVWKESSNLNSKSVQIHLDYDSRIGELEYTHDILLEEINQSKLFKEWFSYDGMTLLKRLDALDSLTDKLEDVEFQMEHFRHFHPWQKHWLEILPLSRNTISALIRSKAKNWVATFNSWYFYNCLSDRTFMNTNSNDNLRKEYIKELNILRDKLPEHIKKSQFGIREESIIRLRKKNKKFYRFFFDKKSSLTSDIGMKDIYKTFGKECSQWFPIHLMTVDAAEELLTYSDAEFDLVIFDDAQHIPSMQAIPLIDKAKKTLVLGDRRQALYPNTHTPLMDMMVEHGADIIPLYYNHIKNERACTEFLNATDYRKGIRKINYFQKPYNGSGITIEKSEGRYIEEEFKNNQEAENIVRILSELHQNKKGKTPRAAIVTSTVPQRNHIHSYLLYIKQKRNPYSDQITRLEENGLRVLHVSELNSHFDTIIWSLTYGTTNLRGHVTRHFDELESQAGQTMLNIILGHVGERLIICSSIPQSHINDKTSDNINAADPINQFLKYAQTTTSGNNDERVELLGRIEWAGISNDDRQQYNFMMQVKKELDPYFETDRIKVLSPLSEIGTSALTIIPFDYRQPIPLIIGDGLDRNNPFVAYEFEEGVDRKLKEAGYLIFRTHSIDWWKNPKREARVLAGKLIKADNTPPEVESVK